MRVPGTVGAAAQRPEHRGVGRLAHVPLGLYGGLGVSSGHPPLRKPGADYWPREVEESGGISPEEEVTSLGLECGIACELSLVKGATGEGEHHGPCWQVGIQGECYGKADFGGT